MRILSLINKKLFLILLGLIALLPLTDLARTGMFVAHDSLDHVARIANFYQSLSEGHIIPRWAGNLNWGYGHPILMFLYPLPSYLASLFHFMGFSLVDSTKIVFATTYIASIMTMFIWMRAQWGSRAAFVGSILYGFSPYRFIDLYVRGAIGEHVAFLFGPLVMYGLFQLASQKKNSAWWRALLALSIAGLMLSHNAVSLMMLPLIGLYGLYLYWFESGRRFDFILNSVIGILIGFGLSSFFWMPAFFEGKYTLRDIVTKGEFGNRFVPWMSFFYSPWNFGGGVEFSKQVGFIHWIGVFLSSWILMTTRDRKLRWFFGIGLVVFIGSLFLMTPGSGIIWQSITLLQKFQFPWRLLTVTTFVSSVLGGVSVVTFLKKPFFLILLVAASIILTQPMWRAKGYATYPESYYRDIYNGTTDTGESSPIWSIRFMEARPKEAIELIEGNVNIIHGRRSTTYHEYAIHVETRARFVENTLYFPGWIVKANGLSLPVEFQDPNHRGLMTFWLDPGVYTATVSFGETKLRSMANIVSGISLMFLTVSILIKRFIS